VAGRRSPGGSHSLEVAGWEGWLVVAGLEGRTPWCGDWKRSGRSSLIPGTADPGHGPVVGTMRLLGEGCCDPAAEHPAEIYPGGAENPAGINPSVAEKSRRVDPTEAASAGSSFAHGVTLGPGFRAPGINWPGARGVPAVLREAPAVGIT